MESIKHFDVKFFFLIAALMIIIVSYRCYKKGHELNQDESKRLSPIIPPSIFSLLALILGFTFSMAISRYEDRRKLTVDEANAISTSYLRSRLLRPVNGIDIKKLYQEYLETRIHYYENDLSNIDRQKANDISFELWRHFEKVVSRDKTIIESNYGTALNNMIDVANARNFSLRKTLPLAIYMIILSISIVAFGMLNFDRGYQKEKSHWGVGVFTFLFIVLFSLIYDIDHSRRGLIRISQDALIETRSIFKLEE